MPAFTQEEAAALYRMATGSDHAPTKEAVEAGAAVPHAYQDAVNRLADMAGPAESQPAEPAKRSGLPRTARRTA